MRKLTGSWLGWLGVVIAFLGLIWQPVALGGLAIILGVIGLFTPVKKPNWAAIIIGILVILLRTL